MKAIKWKILIITSVVCLLPILLGMAVWESLPDSIAIHFNVYGKPDNYGSKAFVVFGLPLIMTAFQWCSCIISDLKVAHKRGLPQKIETVTKWIIPCITVLLYVVTLGYSLGWNIDIRKFVAFVVGVLFVVTGNYMPKLDYIKNYDIEAEKARKINRFIGYATVISGFLFFASIFMPPVSTVVCVFLAVPILIISNVLGVHAARKFE